ncbi:hypothetical protein HK101_010153, partial [Irineochytrium annulatum]
MDDASRFDVSAAATPQPPPPPPLRTQVNVNFGSSNVLDDNDASSGLILAAVHQGSGSNSSRLSAMRQRQASVASNKIQFHAQATVISPPATTPESSPGNSHKLIPEGEPCAVLRVDADPAYTPQRRLSNASFTRIAQYLESTSIALESPQGRSSVVPAYSTLEDMAGVRHKPPADGKQVAPDPEKVIRSSTYDDKSEKGGPAATDDSDDKPLRGFERVRTPTKAPADMPGGSSRGKRSQESVLDPAYATRSERSQSSYGSDSKSVLVFVHATVTFLLIVTLTVVMPGIWVYNFIQVFVILASVLSAVAGRKLSKTVRVSIMASDLIRGAASAHELSDYWINGKKAPSHVVETVSCAIESVAELILIACSILFKWVAVPTLVERGLCNPPVYDQTTLPKGIAIDSFFQGNQEFSTIYSYGLPLKDGMIGGWPGLPLDAPLKAFSITGEGPAYLIQTLCDDGAPYPQMDHAIGTATILNGELIDEDDQSFFLRLQIFFPPGSVYNDAKGHIVETSFIQYCTSMIRVASGNFTVEFPTSINADGFDVTGAILQEGDKYGVLPLIRAAIMGSVNNVSYYPSQGFRVANYMEVVAEPDGYYHSKDTGWGVSTAFGASAHFATNLYNGSVVGPCDYWGHVDSGQLDIPVSAVVTAAIGSGIVILLKIFEILWWSMSTVKEDTPGYSRAVRALAHPFRFAVDMATVITELLKNDAGDDICDADLEDVVNALGRSRIQYGEDIKSAEKVDVNFNDDDNDLLFPASSGNGVGSATASSRPSIRQRQPSVVSNKNLQFHSQATVINPPASSPDPSPAQSHERVDEDEKSDESLHVIDPAARPRRLSNGSFTRMAKYLESTSISIETPPPVGRNSIVPAYTAEDMTGVRKHGSTEKVVKKSSVLEEKAEASAVPAVMDVEETDMPLRGFERVRSVSQKTGEIPAPSRGKKSQESLFDPAFATRSERSQSSYGSDQKRVHPIVKIILAKWDAFISTATVRKIIATLAMQRSKILFWFSVLVFVHATVTFLLIVTLTVVMPGIWVYNFIQVFVILASVLSAVAGRKLSKTVRVSIMASDLIRGAASAHELSDYWINGKKSPSHVVETVSCAIESVAEIILVACSILFKWNAVPTMVQRGLCNPPVYNQITLPPGIAYESFYQGNTEFSTIYSYGLPLKDGLIGGWPGLPLDAPLSQFSITGDGPAYLIQVLCDDGSPYPSIDKSIGTATILDGELIDEDEVSFFLRLKIYFPPGTMYNDEKGQIMKTSFVQYCTSMIRVGNENFTVQYPTSINYDGFDVTKAILLEEDKYGVLPLIKETIMGSITNSSYYPSQGSLYCNYMKAGTAPDGYYHSSVTAQGVSTAFGSAAHFATNLYDGSVIGPCNYWGNQNAGQLDIPVSAVVTATIGSGIVILIKIFEIL